MESPGTGTPQADTGLPPGVQVGPLGARFVAYLLDSAVPAVVAVALQFVLPGLTGSTRLAVILAAAVVSLGWAGFIWHATATRAASPGMRAMNIQLVGFFDGRPIGWGRVLLRNLIFGVLALTGIGLVIMLVLLLRHPRKQGWHDLATQSVIIKARALAPRHQPASVEQSGSSGGPPSVPVTVSTTSGAAASVSGPPAPAAAAPVTPLVAPTTYGPEVRYQQSETRPGPSPYAPQGPRVPAPAKPRSTPPPPTPRVAPAPEEWVIKLDDGRVIPLEGLVLLGRNPQPQPGEEDAHLIKLADQTRTVSKSHLAVGRDGPGAYVVDRGSTNGSTVTAPDGTSTRCQPGDVVPVEPGSIVSMGDHWLEMGRRRTPPEPAAPR